MKKLLAALTLALLCSMALAVSVANATHSTPNDGKHDFVVGGFQDPGTNWAVSAHSGPLGEEPFGHASQTFPQGTPDAKQLRWRVTCVFVSGNLAQVGVVPTKAASNDARAELVLLFRDGGPGGGEGEDPAQLDGFIALGQDADQCRNPAFLSIAAGAPPIEHGNILIHDAQP